MENGQPTENEQTIFREINFWECKSSIEIKPSHREWSMKIKMEIQLHFGFIFFLSE